MSEINLLMGELIRKAPGGNLASLPSSFERLPAFLGVLVPFNMITFQIKSSSSGDRTSASPSGGHDSENADPGPFLPFHDCTYRLLSLKEKLILKEA